MGRTYLLVPSMFDLLTVWSCLCYGVLSAGLGLPPDNTGLVGTLPAPNKPTLPFKFWAKSPKSPLKPRRRDLHEPTLLQLMGADFDPQWMRYTHQPHTPVPVPEDGQRLAVQTLRNLLGDNQLPETLPVEYQALVKDWLVRRATCTVRYVWDDVTVYFWPRWVRRGECDDEADGDRTFRNASASEKSSSCSWPPGMRCVPGLARNLQILRWHCRLRKSADANSIWTPGRVRQAVERRKKRRKRFRCQWLKVPFPVPEECVCSCSR